MFYVFVDDNSDIVKIKGQKDDVDACYKDLSKIVKEMNENSYVLEVPIYKQFHKCIIGRGGNNIRKVRTSEFENVTNIFWLRCNEVSMFQIRDETGTTIDLPAEGDKNDTITITGRKEKVEEAKERILKIQNEMVSDTLSIAFSFGSLRS